MGIRVMVSILWLSGLYDYNFIANIGYGGGERSNYILNVLKNLTGGKVFVIAFKPFLRNVRMRINASIRGDLDFEIISVPFDVSSKIGRVITFPLRRLLGNRHSLSMYFLRARKENISNIIESLRDLDEVVCLFDGLKGFIMARSAVHYISDKCIKIYLSHDYSADYFIGLRNSITSIEREAIEYSDLVIAASIRDAAKYVYELKADPDKVIVFPNIYPVEFRLEEKYDEKTLAIISSRVSKAMERIVRLLLDTRAVEKILIIGRRRLDISGSNIIYKGFIRDRRDFLSTLSRAHLGLNLGEWLGGSNVKKFDYALAGLAVASDSYGLRGELLPGEIPFSDDYDLVAKLNELSLDELNKMGKLNREAVLKMHDEALRALVNRINKLIKLNG